MNKFYHNQLRQQGQIGVLGRGWLPHVAIMCTQQTIDQLCSMSERIFSVLCGSGTFFYVFILIYIAIPCIVRVSSLNFQTLSELLMVPDFQAHLNKVRKVSKV